MIAYPDEWWQVYRPDEQPVGRCWVCYEERLLAARSNYRVVCGYCATRQGVYD